MKSSFAKGVVFLFFFAMGLGVFLFGRYLGGLPVGIRTAIKVFNPLAFGMAALICTRQKALKPYWLVAFAFVLSAFGLLLAWIFRDWPLNMLTVNMNTPRGWAIAKLLEALPMVLPALVLLPVVGMGYGDVYIQRGQPGLSLLLGLGMCALIGLVYGLAGDVFSNLRSMGDIWGWVLLFSIANSFMEELLLRGLFLRPFEDFFSPMGALLLTTLIFTGMHFGANQSGQR